ncbi:MAG TPA: bifunctional DNA primase/polymerase [Blastocatellia bacterium]
MGSTLDCAIDYLSRGWMPIPIPYGSKNPNRKGWQNERWSRDELPQCFNNEQNVGLLLGEPSSGLVDVDLDCSKALTIADEILPTTRMVSGRDASPRSHRWYCCSPLIPTIKFKDPALGSTDERAMIVELRSTGGQTVVPPSIHPSGELYQWYGELSPSVANGHNLLKFVQRLAACALLARHWREGERQEVALAITGGLLRLDWPHRSVEKLIRIVAAAANDDELEKRIEAVEYTERKIRSGEKATGFPTLAELIGERVVSSFQKWLDISPSAKEDRSESSPTSTL